MKLGRRLPRPIERMKLIDAFPAAASRHGLDVGETVEFLGTEGLQQPPIAAR